LLKIKSYYINKNMVGIMIFLIVKTVLKGLAERYPKSKKWIKPIIKILEIIHWISLLFHPFILL